VRRAERVRLGDQSGRDAYKRAMKSSETDRISTPVKHRFRDVARRDGLLAAMRLLNAAVPYRFSAVFRFEGDILCNVCLVDKLDPAVRRTPDQPICDSYCIYIQRSGKLFSVGDSLVDSRVTEHPKRTLFRSYYGVPILSPDGRLLGTACHFDEAPVQVNETVVSTLDDVVGIIAEAMG
jgi:GAF domain-containing protein